MNYHYQQWFNHQSRDFVEVLCELTQTVQLYLKREKDLFVLMVSKMFLLYIESEKSSWHSNCCCVINSIEHVCYKTKNCFSHSNSSLSSRTYQTFFGQCVFFMLATTYLGMIEKFPITTKHNIPNIHIVLFNGWIVWEISASKQDNFYQRFFLFSCSIVQYLFADTLH